MHDLVAVNAAFLYYVASAGEAEAQWLAGVALDRGYEQVLAAREKGPDQVAYAVDRETESSLSVLRLVSEDRRTSLRDSLQPLTSSLKRFGDDQSTRPRDPAVPPRVTDPQ